MAKPDLSIIVVSYNTKKITKDCVNSIKKSLSGSPFKVELIVVDNASSDGSVELLGKESSTRNLIVRIIPNKENVGFGRANNQGVKEAKGEYILLLNSDIVVQDTAIDKLLEYFKANEHRIHFLGGKLLNEDLSAQPSAGPFYTLPVVFGALFLKGDYWGLTRYSPPRARKVDWVSGACIMTKKEYFTALGGFDEGIFMYFEEVDLLYRALKRGYTTWIYPQAEFVHLGASSSGGKKAYPIIQVYRGFAYFYKKHYSPMALIFLTFLLQLKARIAIWVGRATGNAPLVQTYEKAQGTLTMD